MDTDELIVKKFYVKDFTSLPFMATIGTREELAALFGELGYKTGAEIGVKKGEYSLRLCRNAPELELKCVDPWLSFRRNEQIRMDAYFDITCKTLAPYNADIIRKTSIEAWKDFPNNSLDFVYIDAMHEFDSAMVDIILWADKVKLGGIISGHDYTAPTWCNGVILAVQSYTKAHNVTKWYVTTEPTGPRIAPSYFWVKR